MGKSQYVRKGFRSRGEEAWREGTVAQLEVHNAP